MPRQPIAMTAQQFIDTAVEKSKDHPTMDVLLELAGSHWTLKIRCGGTGHSVRKYVGRREGEALHNRTMQALGRPMRYIRC